MYIITYILSFVKAAAASLGVPGNTLCMDLALPADYKMDMDSAFFADNS